MIRHWPSSTSKVARISLLGVLVVFVCAAPTASAECDPHCWKTESNIDHGHGNQATLLPVLLLVSLVPAIFVGVVRQR